MLKFEFSVEEAQLILDALSELPLKRVITTVNKIQDQAKAQLEKKEVESAIEQIIEKKD